MEAVYYAVRANLRRLMRLHPQWTHQQYAQAVGMSVGWVKKWKKRLQEAEPEDEQVLHSRSRARIHPPERIGQAVVDRILQMFPRRHRIARPCLDQARGEAGQCAQRPGPGRGPWLARPSRPDRCWRATSPSSGSSTASAS